VHCVETLALLGLECCEAAVEHRREFTNRRTACFERDKSDVKHRRFWGYDPEQVRSGARTSSQLTSYVIWYHAQSQKLAPEVGTYPRSLLAVVGGKTI
tara:strand:- start:713 stop:1006 length:294 start_codon:yes stop_codon:yes gene_type:complete